MENTYQEAGPRDHIARRAYQLWEESGRPNGRDLDFWLEAERKIAAPRTVLPEQQLILKGQKASTGMELEIRQTSTAIQITRSPSKPNTSPAKVARRKGSSSDARVRRERNLP